MNENDFMTNTTQWKKHTFSKRFKFLLCSAMFLTGLISLTGVIYFIYSIGNLNLIKEEIGIASFLSNILFFLCMFFCFIALEGIRFHEKPFSKTLSICIRLMGILYLFASGLFPLIPDSSAPGFMLLGFFDGSFFTIGLLFYLFGSLLQEAFFMQNEFDEIL